MSRLRQGEREFVSDFGSEPSGAGRPPAAADRVPARTGPPEVDARALSAPLPLLRAHRALRGVQPGQEVRVVTSYPGSLAEFQALAKYATNIELVSQDIVGDEYIHVLRRRR